MVADNHHQCHHQQCLLCIPCIMNNSNVLTIIMVEQVLHKLVEQVANLPDNRKVALLDLSVSCVSIF